VWVKETEAAQMRIEKKVKPWTAELFGLNVAIVILYIKSICTAIQRFSYLSLVRQSQKIT